MKRVKLKNVRKTSLYDSDLFGFAIFPFAKPIIDGSTRASLRQMTLWVKTSNSKTEVILRLRFRPELADYGGSHQFFTSNFFD